MRKNSIKNTRINSEVLREVSKIIRMDVKDPRVSPMLTVTETVVTPDLKYCTVYISVLGSDKIKENCLSGLKTAAPFIRKELARNLNLRNTPELRFELDESLEYGMKMNKLIDEVISKEEARHSEDELDKNEEEK